MDGFWLCKDNPRLDINYAKQLWNWTPGNLEALAELVSSSPNGESITPVIADSTNGYHYIDRSINSTSDNIPFSYINNILYAKLVGDQKRILMLNITQDNNSYPRTIFDLSTNTIHEQTGFEGSAYSSIEDLCDGWFRCISVSKAAYNVDQSTISLLARIHLVQPGTDETLIYTGNSVDGVNIWKSFTFFSDDACHYFPDLTEAASTDYNRSPSLSVRIYPSWDSLFPKTMIRYQTTDQSGRKSIYITGVYNKWKFNVPFLEYERALMINDWWRNHDDIYLYDGISFNTYRCMIVNKSEPFSSLKYPYEDAFTGTIELDLTNA